MPGDFLRIGVPVIPRFDAQACPKFICVVTGFSISGEPKLLYLSTWRRPGIACCQDASHVTPLAAFGVVIETSVAHKLYRCVPVEGAEVTAKTLTGETRPWSPMCDGVEWWPFRRGAFDALDKAYVKEEGQ